MASVTTLPAHTRVEHRELSDSMDRVREELEKVCSSPDADNVHDLRVAIRRCRSVARVFEEIDPDPAWPEMRWTARKLFRALGELRDSHVLADRIKELAPASDPVRVHMLGLLEAEEPKLRDEVARVAGKFDDKAWEHLQRRLQRRVRFIPVGGLAAECLAWERFEEIKQLHAHALRSSKSKPWHALRIGLKKLRYTVEALLPVHYAAWSENLKRLQDLLGEVHDFDVLEDKVEGQTELPEALRDDWKNNLEQERGKRVQTYRQLTLGKTSIGNKWRHGLPHGARLEAASFARLQAAVRAAQARPRKAARVARISLRIFDLLRRVNAAPLFAEPNMRRELRAAALLHGVGLGAKHRRRAARRFLTRMAVPPRWTREDWELVAWVVRFHRGPEPSLENGKFAALSPMEQQQIRALAGVIRLGRVLHRCGVETATGFKIEKSEETVTFSIPGLADSVESAATLAAGKHLLGTALGKAVVLRAAEVTAKVVELLPPGDVLYAVAGASD